jgi:hypothetical protein
MGIVPFPQPPQNSISEQPPTPLYELRCENEEKIMMFASHADQENIVHGHQQAAAAKSLNRSFGAKTPGNSRAPKTPFKIPLNDENAPLRAAGKSAIKTLGGKENGGTIRKKGGKAELSAFVTPAGKPKPHTSDNGQWKLTCLSRTAKPSSAWLQDYQCQSSRLPNTRYSDCRPAIREDEPAEHSQPATSP